MASETDLKGHFLGIDLGGTNVKAGVVAADGTQVSRVSVPTQAAEGPETGLKNIFHAAETALSEAGLTPDDLPVIGLATPGTMDIPAGMLLDPPNLPGWVNVPIRERVAKHFGRPTILQNDANAAAYAEYWVGAGRNAGSMVMWTLGTGVGCGIIVRDMILQGEHSHGSECGHIIVQMDGGRRCDSGQYGTLEAYCSAKSLVRRCQEALASGRRSSQLESHLEDDDALTPVLIGKAAEAGDELADELIMETARILGVATVSLMHTIDPDIVLIGGAMTFGRGESPLGRRFLQRIKDETKVRAFPIPYQRTTVDFARLGGDAGFIGAAGCARQAWMSGKIESGV